jgi:hypothetical protein
MHCATSSHAEAAAARRLLIGAMVWLMFLASARVGVGGAQSAPAGEFFIISSIDPVKEQLIVKRPTEVTQVVRVDAHTKYFDRAKKPIGLSDIRAGDTVYITSSATSGVALEVHRGAMTVTELHRRYLSKQESR